MPVGAFVPSRIHLDYPEWTAPGVGDSGKVWAWNGSGYAPVSLAFDPVGTAAAAVAAHVALSNPHTQYFLASGVSVYGATLASAADAAAARTALALGTAATLNVGTGANQIVQLDGSSRLPAVDGSLLTGITATASPGGSNTQVQYNNAGAFAGDVGMTYNASTDRLTVAGGLVAPSIRPESDSTTHGWQNAAGTAVMVVDTTNSRIGIGGVPSYKLDVAYAAGVNGAAAIRVKNTLATGNATAEFRAENSNGYSARMFKLGSSYVNYKTLAANDIGFYNDANAGNISILNDYASGKVLLTAGGQSSAAIAIQSTNYVGIGQDAASALLDLAASTTSRASLRIRSGTAPSGAGGPNAGDIWYPTGGRLSLYRAAIEIFATGVQATGGAATAGASYTSAEQSMIQKVYDACRAFGLLS